MDPAIKRGFAIGFVGVAIVAALLAWRQNMLPGLGEQHASTAPIPAEIAPGAPAKPSTPDASPAAPESEAGAGAARPNVEPPSAQADRRSPDPGDGAVSPPAGAPKSLVGADWKVGAFDVVRVEPSGEAVVAGRCPAGCTVELTSNGRTLETAKVDASGNFVMTPPPLAPGQHELGLRITTADGKVSTSQQTVTVSVPQKGAGDVVVVLNEPDAPSRILQKPTEAPTAVAVSPSADSAARPAAKLSIAAVDAENGRFFVQGLAPAGAKMRVYLNNAPIAEPVAGADGRWSVKVERGLTSGRYVARVDELDRAGKVVSRAEQSFSYEPQVVAAAVSPGATPAPATPATGASDAANPVVSSIDTTQVVRGDSLWRISRRIYGQGMRYTTIFSANDQIRNPNLIYPGQVLVLPSGGASAQNGAAAR